MARTDVVSVTTAPLTDVVVPASDPAFHADNGPDADQADIGLVRIMAEAPQVRYRQRQGTAASTVGSGDSEQTLAAISNQNTAQNEVVASVPTSTVWNTFLAWLEKLVKSCGTPQIPRSKKMQDEYNKIKYNTIEDHIDGVPRFAAFLDSSEDWSLFRRFGPQATRILIKKEVELQGLAEELYFLDKNDEINPTIKHRLRTTKHEVDETKGQLENKMEIKLNEYYDFLLKHAQVRSLRQATERDHHSVYTYMIQRRPFKKTEDTFFSYIEDLVYAKMESRVEGGQNKRMEDMVEQFASPVPGHWLRNKLHGYLKDKDAKRKAHTDNVHHFSAVRRAVISKFIAASLAVAIILIPVLILYLAISLSPIIRAVVVGVFVFVFLVAVSVLGEWGAHELFFLMATYTAILVALLSNLSQGNVAGSTSK